MAQVTGSSWADLDVEISDDAFSTETAVEGAIASITQSGGGRQSAEEYTADGDTSILVFGKREPVEVTLRAIYDETADSASVQLEFAMAAGSSMNVRWYPRGKTSTYFMFTTIGGQVVTHATPSETDIPGGGPIVVEATIRAVKVLKAVYSA